MYKAFLLFLVLTVKVAVSQDLMLIGGVANPLYPYAGKDVLDDENGQANTGFNLKLDYLILKQNPINFSVSLLYFSNPQDLENVGNQINKINGRNDKYTSIEPYSGIGYGGNIFVFLTPLKYKVKTFAKVSLGQLHAKSPEYTITNDSIYARALSSKGSNIYVAAGLGVEYAILPRISIIGYAEYFYSNLNFGHIRYKNASGRTSIPPNSEQTKLTIEMLNFNVGISYKLYALVENVKKSIQKK